MTRATLAQVVAQIGAVCLGVALAGVSHAEECDAILDQGVRNTSQELKSSDLRSAFKTAMCKNSKTISLRDAGGGVSLGIPIDGVPLKIGGNYNQAQSDTASSGECNDTSSGFSEGTYSNVLKQMVSPEIVSAWSQCKANLGGFFINGSLNGNVLVLEFRFRQFGAVSSTTVTGNPEITGAVCPTPAVMSGTVVTGAKIFQTCYRQSDGPVTVVANSSIDGAKFFIPAVVKYVPVSTTSPEPPAIDCDKYTGPGTPVSCVGHKRLLQGVGTAPPGYTWCILDSKFNNPPNVQGYCFAKETAGACHCAIVPAGYPQPALDWYGQVHPGG